MSVINKKPFIQALLENFNSTELTNLENTLNSKVITLEKNINDLVESNKGICNAKIKFGYKSAFRKGILLFRDTDCTFLLPRNDNEFTIYKINVNEGTFELINELLTFSELRRVMNEQFDKKGGNPINPSELASLLEATDGVICDLNESETKVEVHLDTLINTNSIATKTEVGGEKVMFAKFNPTGHQDNHWHIVNAKVDDKFYVYELEVAGLMVYDISNIGSTATSDTLTEILKAFASSVAVSYNGTILKMEYYKPFQEAQTDDVVLIIQSAIFGNNGSISDLEKFTFTKQLDGSLAVAHISI